MKENALDIRWWEIQRPRFSKQTILQNKFPEWRWIFPWFFFLLTISNWWDRILLELVSRLSGQHMSCLLQVHLCIGKLSKTDWILSESIFKLYGHLNLYPASPVSISGLSHKASKMCHSAVVNSKKKTAAEDI